MSTMPMDMSQFGQVAQGIAGGGDPSGGPDPGQGSQADTSADALLQQAIDLLTQYVQAPDSDPIETHTATKALALLQGNAATSQKNQDAAMGTTPAHKAIAKTTAVAQQLAQAQGGGY